MVDEILGNDWTLDDIYNLRLRLLTEMVETEDAHKIKEWQENFNAEAYALSRNEEAEAYHEHSEVFDKEYDKHVNKYTTSEVQEVFEKICYDYDLMNFETDDYYADEDENAEYEGNFLYELPEKYEQIFDMICVARADYEKYSEDFSCDENQELSKLISDATSELIRAGEQKIKDEYENDDDDEEDEEEVEVEGFEELDITNLRGYDLFDDDLDSSTWDRRDEYFVKNCFYLTEVQISALEENHNNDSSRYFFCKKSDFEKLKSEMLDMRKNYKAFLVADQKRYQDYEAEQGTVTTPH